MPAETPPALPIDPLSPSFIDDPYPALSWLRDQAPAHRGQIAAAQLEVQSGIGEV